MWHSRLWNVVFQLSKHPNQRQSSVLSESWTHIWAFWWGGSGVPPWQPGHYRFSGTARCCYLPHSDALKSGVLRVRTPGSTASFRLHNQHYSRSHVLLCWGTTGLQQQEWVKTSIKYSPCFNIADKWQDAFLKILSVISSELLSGPYFFVLLTQEVGQKMIFHGCMWLSYTLIVSKPSHTCWTQMTNRLSCS